MPLSGRRILEIADAKGAYCGKLFADLGAEVIRIEHSGNDGQSLFFLYMNTSKKSVEADINTVAGQALIRELAKDADLIIETLPPGTLAATGLSYSELAANNPALVLTSITGFGQTGPYRDYRSSDLVASAMGGAMIAVGYPDDPPVKLAGSQAFVVASTLAAASSMIALFHSSRTGHGQQIDISMQEAMLAATSICGVGKWLGDGVVSKRNGASLFAATPSGIYPCKDGHAYLMVNRPLHWLSLARWVNDVTGNEEILDPMFAGPSSHRQPYRELLDLFINELSQQFTVEEFYREGQRRHLAITPLSTGIDIIRNPHLLARGFFVDAGLPGRQLRYPGAPYRFSKTPWRIQRPAPAAGADNNTMQPKQCSAAPLRKANHANITQPLAGLRVVEFTAGMAGPWIGRFMAWCGADVIKVESSRYPDVTRLYIPPGQPELGIQPQLSPWLTDWNAGKRFVSLDLTRPDAADLAKAIIRHCDIVIDNNGNGVLEKLGLGFDVLAEMKPELILFNSTGFGNSGPDANHISWGPNIEALSGLAFLSGFRHRDCTMTQFAYPDPLAALHGLFAIMAAIEHRNRSGSGQAINMSQLEVTLAAIGDILMEPLTNGQPPAKTGNGSPAHALQGCYRCQGDDRWCVISATTEAEWQALCLTIGRPEWLADPRFSERAARQIHQQELDELISAWTTSHDAHAVMQQLQQTGIAAGVVQDVKDQWQHDPHLKARGFFETIPHPLLGSVVAPGIPLGFTATPGRTPDTGRAPGSDNRAILCGLAGLTEDEYRNAVEAGIIEELDR